MKIASTSKILPMVIACLSLLACGGGGGSGGGGGTPAQDKSGGIPTVTLISFVDNDQNPNNAIPEGQTSVRLTTAATVSGTDLVVTIGVKVGNSSEVERTVTIPVGRSEATVTLTELNIDVPDGKNPVDVAIVVKTESDSNYNVNIPGGNVPSTSSLLPDQVEDPPVISVRANATSTSESAGTAGFTFTANKSTDSDLIINFSITESGSMIAQENKNDKTVTLPATNLSAVHDIPLVDDKEIEQKSTITVTLKEGTGYDLPAEKTATMTATDDDVPSLPVFSLSAGNNPNSAFDEGVVASNIKIKALNPVSSSITVMVRIATAGGSPRSVSVQFPAGSNEESVPLTSIIDALSDGATHQITVTIVEDSTNYHIDQNNGASQTYHVATVDRTLPNIRITAGSAVVTEGPNVSVTFTVEVTNKQSVDRNIPVALTHSNVGDYFAQDAFDVLDNKSIADGGRSFVVSIDVHDDIVDEPNGSVTVIISPNPTLFTSTVPGNSATVTILDDDEARPEISVATTTTSVAEADNISIVFTLTSTIAPATAEGLTVHIEIMESGSMISGTPDKTAVIPQNSLTVDVSVDVENDTTEESDSVITLAVRESYDHDNDSMTAEIPVITYTVAESPGGSAMATVTDDDEKVLITDIILERGSNCGTGSVSTLIEGCPVNVIITVGDLTGIRWTDPLTVNLTYSVLEGLHDITTAKLASPPASGTLRRNDLDQRRKAVVATIQTNCNPASETSGEFLVMQVRLAASPGLKWSILGFSNSHVRDVKPGGTVSTCPTATTSQSPPGISPQISTQLHQEILPNVFSATSTHSMNSVSNRIDFAFNNPGSARIELNAANTHRGILETAGKMANDGELSWENIMKGSSFALPLTSGDSPMPITLWGNGFGRDLSNEVNSPFDWEGDASVGQLGFDAAVGNGLLAGLSATSDESSVSFKLSEHSGTYDVRMSSFSPYLAWSNHDLTTQLKISAGYGIGEVEIDYDDFHPETTDSNKYSILFGVKEELANFQGPWGFHTVLALDAEARMARQFVHSNGESIAGVSIGSRNLKTDIAGAIVKVFPSGSVLSPYVSTGADWNGGDYDRGAGIDLFGGLEYADISGIGLSGSNYLRIPSDGDRESGLEGGLTFDSNHDRIGLLLRSKFKFSTESGKTDRKLEAGFGFNPESSIMFVLSKGNGNSAFEINSSVNW